jgi:hypothetical protein
VSEVIRECRGANFQGFETIEPDGSKRRELKTVRGNGVLELTPSELRFERLVPRKEWVIALASVVSVEARTGHNGKWTLGYPAVKVRFADDEGERVFGVLVGRRKAAEEWVEAIRQAVAELPG